MTEAFQCDKCDNYYDGQPAGSFFLYKGREATEDGKIDADVCNDCLEQLYDEFTLPEYYQ